ncbi:MAG: invasin domain 3-containing protein [Methanobacteriaceae archaeon]|nr:invasin domain 3-containing protein [Methanobacteriaceae archaeon]
MNKKMFIIFLSLIMAIVLSGAVSAATTNNDTCADPIINGTVTINEYGNTRPLPNATVTVNSTGTTSRVLATTTTDENGYYSVNFYSTSTSFLVTASYMGCNSVTQTVNVSPSSNPQDPNYYGTSNFQLTPKTATLISTGNGTNVYVAKSGTYTNFAGVINVRIDGTSYKSYCIDLFTPISINDVLLVNGPLPGTAGNLPREVDWTKVNYIIHNYTPSNNTEAAAIQCAIWYFTSAHYGAWPGTDPAHPGYYQFMTHPDDAKTSGGGTTIRNRAFEIITAANAMNYPSSVVLEPEITRVANGSSVTLTATVRDQNGNPLSNTTVRFTTNRGTLSVTTGTTNAQGQISTVLSGVNSNRTATVTAWVEGKYGALLYDDKNNPKQNLVCMNLLPYNLADTSQINFDETANVELTQTVNNSVVNVGDQVNFTITAHNNGPSTATGIMIQDIIPEGLDNVTVIPSLGTFFNNMWVIPSLANGATATLNIIGTVTASMAGITVTNTATRTGQDQYNSRPGSASASVYTKMAMIDIDQTVNTPVNVGDIVTYIVSVTNSGPDTATNIVIEDHPPTNLANLTVTPSVGTFINGIWTIPSLANGATATLTITGNATTEMAGKTTTNTATIINQTEYDPHTIGESTSSSTYTPSVDIRILHYPWYYNTATGQYQDSYMCSNTPVFVMDVRNSSSYDDATGVIVEYVIGTGFEYIGCNTQGVGTASYDPNTRTITWNIGFMPKGGMAFMKIFTKVIETGNKTPNLTNIAKLKHVDQLDINSSNNQVNYAISSPKASDIQVEQSLVTFTENNKQYVTYTINVTNNGPDNATGVQITDKLPSGVQWISDDSQGNYNHNTSGEGAGIWNIGNMVNGETRTLNITCEIIGTGTIKNTSTRTAINEDDWNYNNNSMTTIMIISGTYTPSVDIRILHYPWYYNTATGQYQDSYMCSNTPVFVMDVRNSSSYDDATGVIVEYVIGTGFEYIGCNTQGVGTASYDPNTRTITWNIGFMPKGGMAFMKIFTKVIETGNKTPNLTNIAKLKHVDQLDINSSNNQVNYAISSPKASDIQVEQSLVTFTENNKQYVTYTINVTNNGPDNATGVQITDKLPSGVQWISDDSQGNYNHNTSGEGAGIWNIGNMVNGETRTLNITCEIIGTGTIKNTSTRTAINEDDWNYNNNSMQKFITIAERPLE